MLLSFELHCRNKVGKVVRKRAKGGGRKRSPDAPRAQLSIRMQEGVRDELEEAAKKHGQTVTAELLSRLRRSFDREHEQKRDPAARHFANLVAIVAREIQLGTPSPATAWYRDPFTFRAFKIAVSELLDG